MSNRISLYQKAEQELYKLDRAVKADFYNFCHKFREDKDTAGLQLKQLKGDGRVFSARVSQSYRALLVRAGVDGKGGQSWVVVAVRHRKHVYEEMTVAVNRVTGEIEFVDLSVVGDSVLERAGITLTPAEPEQEPPSATAVPETAPAPAPPLLGDVTAEQLRELGVSEQLIDLALAVTTSAELDLLVAGAPTLSNDVLTGLASGMGLDEVKQEITAQVEVELDDDYADDLGAALARTTVTTVDESLKSVLAEGDFRAWKVFLHPSQAKLVRRDYNGPARVTGGPGTGKTIVALHRVRYLAERLPAGSDQPILLTTFTKNLAADLHKRLASLIDVDLASRVEVVNIDQLAARVLGENTGSGGVKQRVNEATALTVLRQVHAEAGEARWSPEFLYDEWDQVVLGQSLTTRKGYFEARRAGRGRSLTRPERNQIWRLLEQFTTRLDKEGIETWGQAAERAARYEGERAADAESDRDTATQEGQQSGHRYRHVVVDEAQDLRASHWKMLRAMVAPGVNDMFIAGDTHQRIYDHQVTLGTVGVHIRGRSSRLTLSYRTTSEILARAIGIAAPDKIGYDDLDDGVDSLRGYRSLLRGPAPELVACATAADELDQLGKVLITWLEDLSTDDSGSRLDPRGRLAVCVADREMVGQVMNHLAKAGVSCAELTRDGAKGDGEVHVGTMHRFKGLEYQRLAIVGVRDGVIPRHHRGDDPQRREREERKARSLLFVAATRARDTLRISWHGKPSPYLPLNR
ncbi:UvrD-helicase domain-containing protein [Actinosynnema pretiosum subsp. pretiosum]|uniref:DNA 3'-5' helicase n=1 Tax=Actinosynnema pretiosum subsp. pretiosum TaxID=103721 RepID=A0AA45R6S2_9PSEU|nr:putative DNA helicase [Actinosynnema pretiosum subsp. pretiosum]QUF07337.1 UvrD-helicase domain-containing protein [Actinosynnema pretiosum subsp. pretiosum]